MSAITVVSNSTPLIALSRIRKLDLLREYFTEIIIPEAVYQEVVVAGGDLYGAKEIKELDWVKVKKVKNDLAAKALETIVDKGEAEAITLAAELESRLLLIDDAEGRKTAQGIGLRITGTVGVLLMAARDGKIELKGALDQLLSVGFRLSEKEYQRIIGLLAK